MNKVSLYELVFCISDVLDLISNEVMDHHSHVSWASYHLAESMGLTGYEKRDIVIAAALHDIGGLSLSDRLSALFGFEDSTLHAEKGYRLLSVFEPFQGIATLVRYHHALWNYGEPLNTKGNRLSNMPIGSQIILLADRIAVSLKPGVNVLNQAHNIKAAVAKHEGKVYNPLLVSAFQRASQKDSFWLDITSQSLNDLFDRKLKGDDIFYSDDDLMGIMELISSIIDFRSLFTATHSKCVSAVAEELARLMNFSESGCRDMKIAGLLHDIGKLAIPVEILEKNGPLNDYERDIIRTHAYYTDKVLSHLSGFGTIREWASFHHESVDGKGYPFGLNYGDLSLGSKIMKVADIFVALLEKRPYRKGMETEKAMGIIDLMARNLELDPDIVSILIENLAPTITLLFEEEQKATDHYRKFLEGLNIK